jgi:alcohol dehydrogenase class IV
MPKRLRNVAGLDRDRFDHYARLAARDHTLATNPRLATVPELKSMIEAAW